MTCLILPIKDLVGSRLGSRLPVFEALFDAQKLLVRNFCRDLLIQGRLADLLRLRKFSKGPLDPVRNFITIVSTGIRGCGQREEPGAELQGIVLDVLKGIGRLQGVLPVSALASSERAVVVRGYNTIHSSPKERVRTWFYKHGRSAEAQAIPLGMRQQHLHVMWF